VRVERRFAVQLDGITLMVAGCFVAILTGILLFAAWAEMRRSPSLLWWATGSLVNGMAATVLSLGLGTGNNAAIIAGAAGVAASMMLYYAGVELFLRRAPSLWPMAAGAAVWVASALPVVPDNPRTCVAVAFVLAAAVLTAAATELWSNREEQLATQWALIAVFALHAVCIGIGGVGLLGGAIMIEAAPSLFSWFGLIHFERLVFLVGGALFMVLIVRERHEKMAATAADVDALTGVVNRGAFFARAERMRRRAEADGGALSVIAFDLDQFKAINDTFGHSVGDRVLRAFTDAAGAVLRPGDLLGRIGGEEFAAILPGAGIEAAYVVADRVRHAFEKTPKALGENLVHATVSAGIASADKQSTLEALLESADHALYRAKALGRNRVEREAAMSGRVVSNVIRVA
jgi:diguanylate cyclase (GGDEF)-like protein